MWQIHECPDGDVPDKPYVELKGLSENGFVVENWIGYDYEIDLKDGSVRTHGIAK